MEDATFFQATCSDHLDRLQLEAVKEAGSSWKPCGDTEVRNA